MWQGVRAFLGSPIAKGTFAAIKIWQVALAVTVVSASVVGTYTYVRLNTSPHSDMNQRVVVFIGGLNTSMSTCQEGTFADDSRSQILAFLLSQSAGFANPYVKGCNGLDPNQSYLSSPTSIIHFSYKGGVMDPHGYWYPFGYDPCTSVNNDRLSQDVQTFDSMLDAYHRVFPNARFTIVGHSLGGLVGLQGAYDYVINRKNADIDKVITIDSPLEGVVTNGQGGKWLASTEAAHCTASGSVVTSDLLPLGAASTKVVPASQVCATAEQEMLSRCKAQALARAKVGVITLGNDQDSLYCGGSVQTGGGFQYACYTQVLTTAFSAFSKLYHLKPLPSEGFQVGNLIDTGLGAGHFTIIETPEREMDVIRYILAPVVSIAQPLANSTTWFQISGATVDYQSSVYCLFGVANAHRATATITIAGNQTLLAGSGQQQDSSTLTLHGAVHLAPSVTGSSATFAIDAGGDTCHYPSGSDPHIHNATLPTHNDYFGGDASGIPFLLDGGRLAFGTKGLLFAGRPGLTSLQSTSLDYSQYNKDGSNSIQDVAWSHDGTKLAFLVMKQGYYVDGSNIADLYITSSSLSAPRQLVANLAGAIALTWNATDDKIAVLEETVAGQPALAFSLKPSIAIIDASSGTFTRQIDTLPTNSNQSSFFCANTCGPARARIQWGANGDFLIGYGVVGTTLVSASGQSSELPGMPPSSFFGPDEAPMGALNEQGTLVAFPQSNGTRNVNIMLYQVDAANGKVLKPVTLANLTDDNGMTVDFSPDGSHIGICAGKGLYVVDVHLPNQVKMVTALSGLGKFWCENVRWRPDGQSLLVQLGGHPDQVEYGGIVGQAIISLNGTPPQVLTTCGVTATASGLQYSGVFDQSCTYLFAVFAWQPPGK